MYLFSSVPCSPCRQQPQSMLCQPQLFVSSSTMSSEKDIIAGGPSTTVCRCTLIAIVNIYSQCIYFLHRHTFRRPGWRRCHVILAHLLHTPISEERHHRPQYHTDMVGQHSVC